MKTRPVGAGLFHAGTERERERERERDGQTDITKIIVAFANFTNAPTKQQDLIAGKEFHEERNVVNLAPSFTSITSSKPEQKSGQNELRKGILIRNIPISG
jgi:hypothetical protein